MCDKVPKALFNSKALFNPYQYLPFEKVLNWDDESKSFMSNGKNVLVTDEVGVGKTFEIGIILRELLHYNSELTVLILCPVKLCENWKKELLENFYIGATNYYQEKTFGQITILPYSYFSSGKRKSKSMEEEIKTENEMKNSKEMASDLTLHQELSDILPYDILILDEAHYIRNRGTLWSYVNKLIEESEKEESKTKIFMTGTPVFNDEEDYRNITEFLSKELPQGKTQKFGITKTLQSEANCYDQLLNINVWQNGITPNENEQGIISELYATIEKEDDRGNIRKVSKYGRLTGFLKRIASSSIYSLNKFVENREDLVPEMLEYGDGFDEEDFEQDYEQLKISLQEWSMSKQDTKMEALKKLIENNFEGESNKKAIIFSCFVVTCKYLEEQLKEEYHVYIITGGTNAKNVENAKAMFEKDKDPAILICSDAAKEGHNLQFCQLLIHYDLPYTPAAIGQRNGRIYRRGQEGEPNAYYMLFNRGYDLRLFGEIIVGKCQVIKELEEQEKLSWINILPGDADEYIKQCTRQYIEEKLKESDKDIKNSAKDFLKIKFSEIQVDDDGKKKKDDDGKVLRKWSYGKAQEIYNEINSGVVTNDSAIDKITSLFTGREANNKNTLQAYYKKRYNGQIEEFCEKYFERENCKSEHAFIEVCNEFVGKRQNQYCHDMINGDMSIEDYKQQFKPLKEWERG